MNVQIEESWKQHLAPEFEKDYFIRLTEFVRSEYQTATIYPPGRFIFNAFNLCPFDKVKVLAKFTTHFHQSSCATVFYRLGDKNNAEPELKLTSPIKEAKSPSPAPR